jgi:demethylmenaquinone methyltransferase/2-methoxy-6-polyprenyl-1,4-benzoquinol methylase
MAPFNHFDFLAPFYDRFIKSDDLIRFSEFAELPVSGRLLDAGGGTGRKSLPLLNLVTGIVIADSSIGMLTRATRKAGLKTVCAESEKLPFEDESFERVMMVDALHHVTDYRVTAGELWRVLKPGGRIIIEEPDIRMTSIKIMAMIEKLALMRSHFVSPQDIAATFAYPNSEVNIEIVDSVAWILITKHID